ncbi:MAG: hypothetical protein EXR68_00760 [Dehalococcoidia bacterium]|nr:hypothetical protein [Dehalococcoidia bacterium]
MPVPPSASPPLPGPEPGPLLRALSPAPDAIEALSLARIEAEAGLLPWQGDERRLALRLAYAVGDPGILSDIEIAPGALAAGIEALARGAPILTDVRMVAAGIDRRTADALGIEVRCLLDTPGLAQAASARGITRSAQAVLAESYLDGAIVAIGNAPTTLLALLDRIDAGNARPALVLGFPVGYVAATESKEELRRRSVPYVTLRGPRGGTPIAVAAANTLLRLASDRVPAEARTASMPDAILLIGHGSSEPDAARAMERVIVEITERGATPIIEPAFVQLAAPTVPEGIARCVARGARRIAAVPYFLHVGKHVLRDLPALLRQGAEEHPGVSVCLAEPIGSHPGLTQIALDRALRGPFLGDVVEAADALGAAGYVMASAPFVYRADGRPDWSTMWQTFCELALFGGPSHRDAEHALTGTSQRFEPATTSDSIDEIVRGIAETTGLRAEPAEAGWLAVRCENERMAAWMAATIILEYVEARSDGALLYLPAQPSFAIEDEVKSVITVTAKAHHYWMASHIPPRPTPPRDRGPRGRGAIQ